MITQSSVFKKIELMKPRTPKNRTIVATTIKVKVELGPKGHAAIGHIP